MNASNTWDDFCGHYKTFILNSDKRAGIYMMTNTKTAKVYVGQSGNMASRVHWHILKLQAGAHRCKPLQAEFDEYLLEAFRFEVMECVEEPEHRYRREVEITETFDPETLYSTWETLDKEARRRACNAKLDKQQVEYIRMVGALTAVSYGAIADMSSLNLGVRITKPTAWDVIQGKVYGDPAYHVPDHRQAIVTDAWMPV